MNEVFENIQLKDPKNYPGRNRDSSMTISNKVIESFF